MNLSKGGSASTFKTINETSIHKDLIAIQIQLYCHFLFIASSLPAWTTATVFCLLSLEKNDPFSELLHIDNAVVPSDLRPPSSSPFLLSIWPPSRPEASATLRLVFGTIDHLTSVTQTHYPLFKTRLKAHSFPIAYSLSFCPYQSLF